MDFGYGEGVREGVGWGVRGNGREGVEQVVMGLGVIVNNSVVNIAEIWIIMVSLNLVHCVVEEIGFFLVSSGCDLGSDKSGYGCFLGATREAFEDFPSLGGGGIFVNFLAGLSPAVCMVVAELALN